MQSQQDLRALSEKQLRSFCIAAVQKEFQKTAARRCKIMVVGRERVRNAIASLRATYAFAKYLMRGTGRKDDVGTEHSQGPVRCPGQF